jgi:hypothetical protein
MSIPIGASWPGRVTHEGHVITKIEDWPARIENATVELENGQITCVRDGLVTAGRVRCSCGKEWNVGGWPIDDVTHPRSLLDDNTKDS